MELRDFVDGERRRATGRQISRSNPRTYTSCVLQRQQIPPIFPLQDTPKLNRVVSGILRDRPLATMSHFPHPGPESVLRTYLHAKDENRPHLLDTVFAEAAKLEVRNKSSTIAFPAVTVGREAIADALVRGFGQVHAAWIHYYGGAAWGEEENRAVVRVFDPEGKTIRNHATGLRNCSGMTIQPDTEALWCTGDERDHVVRKEGLDHERASADRSKVLLGAVLRVRADALRELDGDLALGLAQVDAFARQCGGVAELETAPGKGTRVSVILPACGASFESLYFSDMPCFQAGAGAGLSWA